MMLFASHFWLWTIIGVLLFFLLYTFGALMNFVGFITPLRAAGEWLDRSSLSARLGLLAIVVALLAYPSFIHKLWADATAEGVRHEFRALPVFPGARPAETTEVMGGLYDPTSTDGAYILRWFGTVATPGEVRAYYSRALSESGWVQRHDDDRAARFWDHADRVSAHYELVLAVAPQGSAEVPVTLASEPTAFALRLGAIDPRVTTQVAWFVDCLVHRAPTFPSCEAAGWHPVDSVPRPSIAR